jgi:hypothetical protein
MQENQRRRSRIACGFIGETAVSGFQACRKSHAGLRFARRAMLTGFERMESKNFIFKAMFEDCLPDLGRFLARA